MKKMYEFTVRRQPALCQGLGVSPDMSFKLELSQVEFEDYQLLKERIHAQLISMGIPANENVYWYEDPPVTNSFLEKMRAAICSHADAQFIAHYPHSYHHRHYKDAVVDGVAYKYMPFQQGLMIKFAPSMA